MATDFEELMAPRLEATRGEEGSRVVLELWDGRRLEDAVLDAIESLPARKTKRLRTWIEQLDDFREWLALEKRGFRIEPRKGLVPKRGAKFIVWVPILEEEPSIDELERVVAAAIGALGVRESETKWVTRTTGDTPSAGLTFVVTREA